MWPAGESSTRLFTKEEQNTADATLCNVLLQHDCAYRWGVAWAEAAMPRRVRPGKCLLARRAKQITSMANNVPLQQHSD